MWVLMEALILSYLAQVVLEVKQIFPPDGRPKVRLGLKQVGIILWGTRISALNSMSTICGGGTETYLCTCVNI